MQIRLAVVVLLLTCLAGARQNNSAAQPKPCAEPEQKQFEFWVGEWDLTWPGNSRGQTDHGTNSVQRILEGCILQENFSGADAMHLRGQSVSIFDASPRKWKQTWVDNEGAYLDFRGLADSLQAEVKGGPQTSDLGLQATGSSRRPRDDARF